MSIPQRPYDMSTRGVGGSDVSAAGVPAAFEIRRDNLLRLTLRFPEHEWDDVERAVRHLQKAGSATFYPDQDDTSVAYTVYGESPAMGTEIRPRRSDFPRVLELDVTLRRTTDVIFDDPFYSDALLYWLAGTDVTGSVFARADIATYVDVDGVLQTAATGVRRTTWLGANGSRVPYELTEGARTNLCLRSEEFDNAAWSDTVTPVVTANDAVAPDGATTADKIEDNDGAAFEARFQDVTVADDGADHCASAYVKKVSTFSATCMLQLGYIGGTTLFPKVHLNPATGEIAAESSPDDFGVEELADYWRIWVTMANNSSGNVTARPEFFPAVHNTAASIGTRDVAATGFQHVWGAQLEQAAFPSSYVPTTTVAVARVADVLTFPFTAPPQEMTVYAKFKEQGTILTDGAAIIHIGSASPTDLLFQVRQDSGTGKYEVLHDNGPATVISTLTGTAPVRDQVVELRAELRADGSVQIGQVINSGADDLSTQTAANALAAAWLGQLVYINSRGGSSGIGFNAHAAIKIVPGIHTMAQMRAL